jgi:hypothetical protein
LLQLCEGTAFANLLSTRVWCWVGSAVAVSAGGVNPFAQPLLQLLPAAKSLSQVNHYAGNMRLWVFLASNRKSQGWFWPHGAIHLMCRILRKIVIQTVWKRTSRFLRWLLRGQVVWTSIQKCHYFNALELQHNKLIASPASVTSQTDIKVINEYASFVKQ